MLTLLIRVLLEVLVKSWKGDVLTIKVISLDRGRRESRGNIRFTVDDLI